MAVAVPPPPPGIGSSLISRSTVLMVECLELGSGGNGLVCCAFDVDFAATTTYILI